MQNWYAPSLTSNKEAGLGEWSIKDITDLSAHRRLRARRGLRADGRGRLQQPAISQRRGHPRHGGLPEEPRAGQPRRNPRRPRCRRPRAVCCSALGKTDLRHANARAATARPGEGKPPQYPPLAGNQSIQMASAVNPIRMVLNGGFPPGTEGNPMPYGMPPFAQSCPTTRSPPSSPISAPPGAIAAAGRRRVQANELRSAPLELRAP